MRDPAYNWVAHQTRDQGMLVAKVLICLAWRRIASVKGAYRAHALKIIIHHAFALLTVTQL